MSETMQVDLETYNELRRDAKRYNILRDNPAGPWYFPKKMKNSIDAAETLVMVLAGGEDLDKAVDEYDEDEFGDYYRMVLIK